MSSRSCSFATDVSGFAFGFRLVVFVAVVALGVLAPALLTPAFFVSSAACSVAVFALDPALDFVDFIAVAFLVGAAFAVAFAALPFASALAADVVFWAAFVGALFAAGAADFELDFLVMG
jgi:hypothetical protein